MHINGNYVLKTSYYAKAKALKYNHCQKETSFVANTALGATFSQGNYSEVGTKQLGKLLYLCILNSSFEGSLPLFPNKFFPALPCVTSFKFTNCLV